MEHDQPNQKDDYFDEGVCDVDDLKFQFWRLLGGEPPKSAENMYSMSLDPVELRVLGAAGHAAGIASPRWPWRA